MTKLGWLKTHLDVSVVAGEINAEQRDRILARAAASSSSASQDIILAFVGVLLAAALISFVASNWQDIPATLRLSGLLALNAALLTGAFVFSGRSGPRASVCHEICAALSAVCAVATIALVAQMYHLPPDEDGFAISASLIGLLTAAVTRTRATLALTALPLIAWSMLDRGPATLQLTGQPVFALGLLLAVLAPTALLLTGRVKGGALIALSAIAPAFVLILADTRMFERAHFDLAFSCSVMALVIAATLTRLWRWPALDPFIPALFITSLALSIPGLFWDGLKGLSLGPVAIPVLITLGVTLVASNLPRPTPVLLIGLAAALPGLSDLLMRNNDLAFLDALGISLKVLGPAAALAIAAQLDGRPKLALFGGLVFGGMAVFLISQAENLLMTSLTLLIFAGLGFLALTLMRWLSRKDAVSGASA